MGQPASHPGKITCEDLAIRAGGFERRGITLHIPEGQCAVLMGKTGCGKTTLMETLCGLRPAAAGRILISGQDVTSLPPRNRGIGYVPQDVALFSSLSVFENIAFALRIRGWGETRIRERVEPPPRCPSPCCPFCPHAGMARHRGSAREGRRFGD